MIVKIQVPLECSHPGKEQALIYNKERDFEVLAPITLVISDLMAGDYKVYAEINPTDPIQIIKKLPDQGW